MDGVGGRPGAKHEARQPSRTFNTTSCSGPSLVCFVLRSGGGSALVVKPLSGTVILTDANTTQHNNTSTKAQDTPSSRVLISSTSPPNPSLPRPTPCYAKVPPQASPHHHDHPAPVHRPPKPRQCLAGTALRAALSDISIPHGQRRHQGSRLWARARGGGRWR